MKQSASPSRRLKHRKQPPEYKAPRSSFASVAGCLTDDLQGGVRITRTCISNLTTWTEETKTPPAFVQTDGDSTIAYENASASPWGVPTCSGAGGVNDPFTDKQKIASRAGETKNPPADFRKGWRGLSNYQTTKLTSANSGLFVPVAALVGVDYSHHDKKNIATWFGETKTTARRYSIYLFF